MNPVYMGVYKYFFCFLDFFLNVAKVTTERKSCLIAAKLHKRPV